jgi:hypothetical protein
MEDISTANVFSLDLCFAFGYHVGSQHMKMKGPATDHMLISNIIQYLWLMHIKQRDKLKHKKTW